ncbi:hypothetical protein PPACK8108_LOCUS22324 [Phakopsora pachyrhizi]|uniref:Uncharacterized protein n=1 Tax=Phakopsora pachyrhizi TaxID=170000 RepID=A0AAV0BM31_PHAPC|nr:hypothetical protein PPACK8108_LOCUS22324 [Phakopsora pachyrhizi]
MFVMAFRNKWKLSPTFILRNNVLQQGYINHKVVAEDRGLQIVLGSLSLMEIALFETNMPLLAPLFKASLPSFPFLNDFDKLFSTLLNLAFSLAAIFAHLAATKLTLPPLPPLSSLCSPIFNYIGQSLSNQKSSTAVPLITSSSGSLCDGNGLLFKSSFPFPVNN